MIFYLFIVLLVIYLYRYYKNNYFYFKDQGILGAFPIPFFDDLYQYFFMPMHEADIYRMNKYGKIYHSFMAFSNEVCVTDPDLIKEILVKNFRQYNGRNDPTIFHKYFQKVLFLRDETNGWRHIRNSISPLFTTGKLKALYSNLDKPMRNLLESMEKQMETKNHIEYFNPKINFKRFTWDITLNLFFSVKFNSFKIQDDDFIEKFLSAKPNDTLKNIASLFMPMSIAKLFKIIPMDKQTYNYLVELVLSCIQQRKKNSQANYNDLLQLLIQTGIPDDEVVGSCLALFLGGFESVAQSCALALYELALQPQIQDRLYKELKATYPSDDLEIDYDKISSSPYLEAVIKETLRKHVGISKLFRKALVDSELGDYKLKKGTFVSIPVHALHHNEKYFPNASKFDPERFMGKDPLPFTYLPFSEGSRMCIAMRLAQLEIRYFLINFLKRYESYRTDRTRSTPRYYKFNFLLNMDDVIVGIRKRKSD